MSKNARQRERQTIIFYQKTPNVETLLNWIRDLPPQDRSALGLDLDLVQSEWRIEVKPPIGPDAAEAEVPPAAGLFSGFRRQKPAQSDEEMEDEVPGDGAPTDRVGRVTTGLFGGFKKPKPGNPLCRKLDDKIWEMQSAMPSGQITSLLFFIKDGTIHVVNGSIITSNDIPAELMLLARTRMESMLAETQ